MEKSKFAYLAYILLLHYFEKCKKVIFKSLASSIYLAPILICMFLDVRHSIHC